MTGPKDCVVVVMAKAPVPGFAKTRLIPALSAKGAAALAQQMLEHAVQEALAAELGMVDLCCTPSTEHPALARYDPTPCLVLSTQAPGDLGARMAHAFERWLQLQARPPDRVLLMGTDAPALDRHMLQRAELLLREVDAVFVPAHDGGYALVGLQRPRPELFNDMPWSTPQVMERTRERMVAARLSHIEMTAVADIDEPEDLKQLPSTWWPRQAP
jgi:uncharacterized protein